MCGAAGISAILLVGKITMPTSRHLIDYSEILGQAHESKGERCMTNQDHIALLKQGVAIWNQWRDRNIGVVPELTDADLINIDLIEANLFKANLCGATLRGSSLCYADLRLAALQKANLSYANLFRANCQEANFQGANFQGANLHGANLQKANLSEVNLWETKLSAANLNRVNLQGADFSKAVIVETAFMNIDLSTVKGLDAVEHMGPSNLGIDTIYRSKGQIPEVFLRKAGVPDSFITYMRSLVGSPLDFYSCFISYSSHDQDFATRLYADLQVNGVRCWFAPEDLKIGDKFRPRIDESIRLYDKLLLVLSENSLESGWVEREVEMALEREHQEKRTMLFPIRLDGAIFEMDQDGWAADVRYRRHIGDFTRWKDHDAYQQAFARLLRDLKAEHNSKD
jgi:uncharacterized protein YjbI with pentapeptide repeats